jgi:hypothetical protein
MPARDIFYTALPSRTSSLVGECEEKRWELRKKDQHENLEMRHRFNGLTHGFFHFQHLSY